MGRKKKPPTPPSTGVGAASRGTADRLGEIKRLAEKRKGAFGAVGDLNNPSTRGTVLEWMGTEEWMQELRREGFTEFYARRSRQGPRKGELPRGAREFGSDEFGKFLSKTFPSGGPDLVAVDPKGKRLLVGDITAGEWSSATVPVQPGDLHRQPAELRGEAAEVHHLVKTQRDANRVHARLPESHKEFSVSFQDRYTESSRKASKRFEIKRTTRGTGGESRLANAGDAAASRGVQGADRAEREVASLARTGETDISRGLAKADHALVPHVDPHLPHPRLSTAARAAETAATFAERGFKARTLVIGVKAWRAARTIGKVLVICFVPLTALDVVIEVAMRLWDAHREKEERKRRDKQKAIEAVLKEGVNWIDEAMGKKPPPSLSQLIERDISNNVKVQEQFLRDWEANPGFNGFQYARVVAVLRIETYRDIRGEDNEELTTYRVESREVHAVTVGWQFELEDLGQAQEVEKTDADNEALIKTIGPVGIAMRKMILRKTLKHTIVPPLLTPFDLVVTKMNNLFVDIVQFTAAFTGAGGEVFTRPFAFSYRYPEWQTQFDALPDFATPPLNREACEYCLGYLYYAAKRLSRHPLEQQDLEGNLEDPRRGWRRRLELLTPLLERRDPVHDRNFSDFAAQVKRLVTRRQQSEDINAALDELYAGARSIWYDLQRIEKNLYKPEYYYFGPDYVTDR
jgi:hypothetical protein